MPLTNAEIQKRWRDKRNALASALEHGGNSEAAPNGISVFAVAFLLDALVDGDPCACTDRVHSVNWLQLRCFSAHAADAPTTRVMRPS
jgi:hypothetical protein